jgi:hypothetical protein
MNSSSNLEYRPAHWLLLLTGATAAFFLVLAVVALALSVPLWQRVSATVMMIVAVLGVADVASRRLCLTSTGIDYVANFRSRSIPRSEIHSVTWAKGCGVSLKLINGGWVHLPDVGHNSQSLTNSIRAWLNRTAPEA